jgi:VWFA-related protein
MKMRDRFVCLVLVATAWAPVPAQVKFSTNVDSVRLDVMVTARGRPLPSLTAADFDVRDNGVRQRVTMLGAGAYPIDVVLALDISSSLSMVRLRGLQSAGSGLVRALQPDDRAALITFNHAVVRRHSLAGPAPALETALSEVSPSGATALIDAMYAALATEENGDRRTLLIVFSDGIDTASWLPPSAVVEAARQSGTVIYGVSTTPRNQAAEALRQVTEATGGDVLHVDSSGLHKAFETILAEFRNRYLLSYTLGGTPQPGWHQIDVRVKRRGAVVRTRQGYVVTGSR